jgi:Bacterial SH3 domain.
MKYLSGICLILGFALGAIGQERFVKPVDEAAKDASFTAFRKKLIAAIDRKDSKYILSIVASDIKNGFGGEDGIANFRKNWKIDRKGSKFWTEFSAVVKNGGKFNGRDLFTAPYSFDGFPSDLDVFEHSLIFGNNVNLREMPAMDGKVIDRLSYNVVLTVDTAPASGTDDVPDWVKIKTLGGKTGWVKAEYVRSPIDYRAGFEKKRGVWKMTFFLAGD